MSAFGKIGGSDPLAIGEGVVGWEVAGERMTLALIALDPNAVVPEHAHENEQVGLLLKGSLRFRVGAEERELRSGASWSIRSQTPHAVTAGPDGARLVEAFAPARGDWADLQRMPGHRVELG